MCCSYFRLHNPQMCVQKPAALPLFVLHSHADKEKRFHQSSATATQQRLALLQIAVTQRVQLIVPLLTPGESDVPSHDIVRL